MIVAPYTLIFYCYRKLFLITFSFIYEINGLIFDLLEEVVYFNFFFVEIILCHRLFSRCHWFLKRFDLLFRTCKILTHFPIKRLHLLTIPISASTFLSRYQFIQMFFQSFLVFVEEAMAELFWFLR